jgi:EmrB/QacA subfamily drug resistance transporter
MSDNPAPTPQQELPNEPVAGPEPEHRRKLLPYGQPGFVLGAIVTCQLMLQLDTSIVNIALPQMRRDLHFSPANLSWVINAYVLTFGGLLLLGARTGDIVGRRRTFLSGITLFVVASLAGGFATSGWMLLAARALQGVGAAFAAPTTLALITTMFSEGRERARALALFTAVSFGGMAGGLVLGGVLTQLASWRWVMFVNVPIGIAVLVVAYFVLPETSHQRGRFDLAGALTSTLGMAALVYGFISAGANGWTESGTEIAFIVGVVLLSIFVITERRVSAPITPLRLFADRSRVGSYVARLLQIGGMLGMPFFLTQFLQNVLGYSPLQAGVAFLPFAVSVVSASQLTGRVLVGRVNSKVVMVGGLGLSAVGLLWLTQLSQASSYSDVLWPIVIFGIGGGLAFVPLTAASLAGVEPRDASAASGLFNVMQQVGGSLGLAVLVTVFDATSKRAAIHGTAANSVNHVFIVGADRGFFAAAVFLAAGALIAALLIRRPAPMAKSA